MGSALAVRLAVAGIDVLVGSRDRARSQNAIDSALERWRGFSNVNFPGAANKMRGVANDVAASGDVVIVTTPFDALESVQRFASELSGKLVLSAVNRLVVDDGELLPLVTPVSAAQTLQQMLPGSAVVTAFNHVSARGLGNPSTDVGGDVLVCADEPEAFDRASSIVRLVSSHLRPLYAGSLELSMVVEDFTALILGVNRRLGHRVCVRISREEITES